MIAPHDSDGDGRLSLSEFASLVDQLNIAGLTRVGRITDLFMGIDANNDMEVDSEELLAFMFTWD